MNILTSHFFEIIGISYFNNRIYVRGTGIMAKKFYICRLRTPYVEEAVEEVMRRRKKRKERGCKNNSRSRRRRRRRKSSTSRKIDNGM